MKRNKTIKSSRHFFSISGIALLVTALFGTACGNWDQFGNGPMNPQHSDSPGPVAGLSLQHDLLTPAAGAVHDFEVGVLVDRSGDYYVSSYDPNIHVYDHAGAWMGSYDLGLDGPRAAPYVDTHWQTSGSKATIFTGAEGGYFHAINVDKTTLPYTITLSDVDNSFGPSESSPKRARDKTLYIASKGGDVVRYEYTATGALNRLNTYSLGRDVEGAIALYDVDPQYPEEEVLVATSDGFFFVLDHRLTTIIWSEASGSPTRDRYYAGVTVAERGSMPAVALLPIAHHNVDPSPNSGLLRAINLQTRLVEWQLAPSQTVVAKHAVEGSVAVLHDQSTFSGGTYIPGDNGTGGHFNPGGGMLDNNNPGSGGGFVIDIPGENPIDRRNTSPYHVTFASTDGFLYGADIVSGMEIWNYQMSHSGYDAPVVDADNIIYVGDGFSDLHAVEGKFTCLGCGIWVDGSINMGGASDVVKLGVTNDRGLVVGSGVSAYALFQ